MININTNITVLNTFLTLSSLKESILHIWPAMAT